MKHAFRQMFIGVALASVVPIAAAQEATPYIGGTIGHGTVDACGVIPAGVTCDDSTIAWKAFAGFQVNKNFAVELGYGRIAEASAAGPGGSIDLEANAFDASAILSYPMTQQFSVLGRLGMHRTTTKVNSTIGITGDETTTDLTFGMGVRYDINRNLGLRVEWQRYKDIGGDQVGKEDADLFGLSVIWRF